MFLKTYQGDVEDVGACFTVTEDCFGEHTEIDLVPNGADIPVTADNLQHYITLVSNKRLNSDIFHQTRAFLKGRSLPLSVPLSISATATIQVTGHSHYHTATVTVASTVFASYFFMFVIDSVDAVGGQASNR